MCSKFMEIAELGETLRKDKFYLEPDKGDLVFSQLKKAKLK